MSGFLVFGLYLLLSLSFAQVTNLDDAGPGSLRDVMAAAADGATITFQAGLSGTINTASTLTIALNNLTIDATGATIAVDGQGTHGVFNHTGNDTLTLINMTVQNGNNVGGFGGGIFGNRNVTLINSTVSGNTAGINGGGIYSTRATTLTNSTVTNNRAPGVSGNGGGVYSGRELTLTNSTVSGNTAGNDGGGIFSARTTTLTNSMVTNNTAVDGGGIYSSRELTLTNSTVSGNSAGDDGGGIYGARNVTLTDSVVVNNTAVDIGGGIAKIGNGPVTITNSLIAGNRAGGNGGGVRAFRAIIVNNGTITGNRGGDGGGLYSVNNATTLNNSLVLGNDAPANPQIRFAAGLNVNNSAYGFGVGESSGDSFVGLTVADVFVNPEPAASAPTTAGDYRLVNGSPALNSGDDSLVIGTTDLDGNDRIQGPAVDIGAYESAFRPVINPNQDIQVRNGNSTAAASITSNGTEVLSYGPFNRGQNVVLEYLVRNPGARTLELGELVLPSFLSVTGEALPTTLGSFESTLLELTVDTSQAGTFAGQVSLASNDPDTNENPFTFNLIISVGNTPANALYVLPGIDLEDTAITPNQQNVPVYSAYLITPEGSADVTINSLTLNTDDIPALRDVQSLTLLIDGGTRGIQDNRDVVLTIIDDPTATDTITFEFEERILQSNLPLWLLMTANF
ncbi:MAG: choice-of-anchor Q domain-containing protein [Deinococcota bacterium]